MIQAGSRLLSVDLIFADVAELAYAIALGAIGATLGGSNPFVRIIDYVEKKIALRENPLPPIVLFKKTCGFRF